MAPTHLSHLSLASTHRPSIAIFLIIIISVSIVPFLALPSSALIPPAFPNLAHTLWDSVFGIVTSSPFYFFLLNFLIVALVCLSGVLDPSPKRQDSDELQDGERPHNDYHSIIHERLALDEYYGSQAPSPSYLRFIERSNVYVADEAHSNEYRGESSMSKQTLTKPTTSNLRKIPAFTEMEASHNVVFSASKIHSTNTSKIIELDVIENAVVNSSTMKNKMVVSPVSCISVDGNHIADLHNERIYYADKIINVKAVQVCDEDHHGDRDARDDAEDGIKSDNDANCGDGDLQSDERSGVYDEEHNGHDDDGNADDGGQNGDVFQESDTIPRSVPQSHVLLLQTQMHQMMGRADEQGNAGDKERTSDEVDVSAKGRDAKEEKSGERQGSGPEEKLSEREEVEMMSMSREELNERASAFISAFRRKLSSTALVDD